MRICCERSRWKWEFRISIPVETGMIKLLPTLYHLLLQKISRFSMVELRCKVKLPQPATRFHVMLLEILSDSRYNSKTLLNLRRTKFVIEIC